VRGGGVNERAKGEDSGCDLKLPTHSRRVSVTDIDAIDHSTCVNADALLEAVARGLKAISESVWAGEISVGISTVTGCAAPPGTWNTPQSRIIQIVVGTAKLCRRRMCSTTSAISSFTEVDTLIGAVCFRAVD
jgi:hypothetical protein